MRASNRGRPTRCERVEEVPARLDCNVAPVENADHPTSVPAPNGVLMTRAPSDCQLAAPKGIRFQASMSRGGIDRSATGSKFVRLGSRRAPPSDEKAGSLVVALVVVIRPRARSSTRGGARRVGGGGPACVPAKISSRAWADVCGFRPAGVTAAARRRDSTIRVLWNSLQGR